jgi:hypothetical protein
VPKRENFYSAIIAELVVQVVTNAIKVKAPYSLQSCIQRRRTDSGLRCDENEGLL